MSSRKGNQRAVTPYSEPWGNSENAELQAPDSWLYIYTHTHICKCFNEPWLLHLPMDRRMLNFLRCCLLGLKLNISKSTCIKLTLFQENKGRQISTSGKLSLMADTPKKILLTQQLEGSLSLFPQDCGMDFWQQGNVSSKSQFWLLHASIFCRFFGYNHT